MCIQCRRFVVRQLSLSEQPRGSTDAMRSMQGRMLLAEVQMLKMRRIGLQMAKRNEKEMPRRRQALLELFRRTSCNKRRKETYA